MGYFKDTIKGISWTGALRGFNRGIVFVKLAILARLLTPEQFGVFGIATLVLAFLEIITETGINIFLIQEKADLKKYVNTAWIVSIARGFLITIFLFLLSPVISSFFNSPASYQLLLLISLVPLIRGFVNPAIVKYQKDLNFSKEFLFRFSIYFIDAFAAIIIALKTHSPLALVLGMITAAIFEVIFSHLFIKPMPKFKFEFEKVKRVVNRGKWLTAAGLFNYLFVNVDDAVVGRLMNTASLGLYQMVYKISSLPLTEVSDVVQRVTFPVYVKIADDRLRLKRAFIKSMSATAILILPLGIALLIFPSQIVQILLGERWLATVPVVRIMSFFGVIRALTISSYSLFLALKKQEYVSLITLVGIVGLGVSIVPLVNKYGITGAGFSALIGSIVSVPVVAYYLNKVFQKR